MKSPILSIVLLLMSLLLLSSCDNDGDKKGRFLLKGNEKLKENDTKSALEFYTEALKIDPDYKDARYNRGIVYQRLFRLDDAINDYTHIINNSPNDSLTLFQRGLSYLDNGEFYKSLGDAEKLTEEFPLNWQGHFLHGLVLDQFKNHEEALSAFERGLVLEPSNPDLLVNKATILFYAKMYDEATEILEKAETLNPSEANIFNLRSMIAFEKENYQEALDWVEKAIQINPRQAYYYNNRGLYKLYKENLDEGLEDINYSLKQNPKNLFALRNKGIYYVMKSERELALRYLKEVAEKDPEMELVEIYLQKAQAL